MGEFLRGFVTISLGIFSGKFRESYGFEGFVMFGCWSLQNADAANFSIYIHSQPGFVFDETTSRSRFFYNRQLSNSIQVRRIKI